MTEKQKLARENELRDLQVVAKTVEGQRFLLRLIRRAGLYRGSLVDLDPYRTAALEGERNVALWLLAEMKDAKVWTCVRKLEDTDDE